MHAYAERGHFAREVVDQLAVLWIDDRREEDRATETTARLVQLDVVSAQPGDAGRLETGRTSAHDQHACGFSPGPRGTIGTSASYAVCGLTAQRTLRPKKIWLMHV